MQTRLHRIITTERARTREYSARFDKAQKRRCKVIRFNSVERMRVSGKFARAPIHLDQIARRERQQIDEERKRKRDRLIAASSVTTLVIERRTQFTLAEPRERTA